MPFVALDGGTRVAPFEVDVTGTYTCPACQRPVGVRETHYNNGKLISRHFYHLQNGHDCSGETDIHKRMKTIAHATLRHQFDNVTVEEEVGLGDRIVDVLATFDTPQFPYGRGIAVEPQHKHTDKDIGAVQHEYLDHGYSVFWAYQSDFNGLGMTIADDRFRTVWPDAVPRTPEWSGYPDSRDVFTAEASTHPVEIDLPTAYWHAHRHELLSPMQANHAPGWTKLDDVWLHGKGTTIAWFNVYHTANDRLCLEFWEKNKRTNTAQFLPVFCGPSTPDQLRDFIADAKAAIDDGSAFTTHDDWRTIARCDFPGTAMTTGWLSFGKPADGQLCLTLGRADTNGNTRTLSRPYRRGDFTRLDDLPTVVARGCDRLADRQYVHAVHG